MARIEWEGSSGWLMGEFDENSPTEITVDGVTITLGEGHISFEELNA